MQQIIHEELTKLQEELQTLDTAVKHIAKAEEIATAVVNSVQAVQENYKTLLNEVREHYTSYLAQVAAAHQHSVEAVEETFDEKVSQTQQEMQTSIQKFTTEFHSVIEAYRSQLQEIQGYLADVPTLHVAHLKELQQLFQEAVTHTHQDIKTSVEKITTPLETTVTQFQQGMQGEIQKFTTDAHAIVETYRAQAQEIQEYLANIPTLQETHLKELQRLFQEMVTQTHMDIKTNVEKTTAPLETTVTQFQQEMQSEIQKFTAEAQTIAEAYSTRAKDIQAYLENIPAHHDSHLNKIQELIQDALAQMHQEIRTGGEHFAQRSDGALQAFEFKLQETKTVLDESNRLITQLQLLLERFKVYDIPQRLDKLDLATIGIQQGLQNILMRTETLERNLLPRMENLEKRVTREMQNVLTTILAKIEEQNQEIQALKKPWWAMFKK